MIEEINIVKDVKSSGKAIVGIISFATAVSTILVEAFKFDAQITIGGTIAITFMVICSVLFIARIENRVNSMLKNHITDADNTIANFEIAIYEIKKMTAEVRRDTLRIQLRNYIKDEPDNLDTILTIANEYFIKCKGNWIAHHEFLDWADEYKVHIPNNLMNAIINVKGYGKDK